MEYHMDIVYLLLAAVLPLVRGGLPIHGPGVKGEYCETEVFKVMCDIDEVIMMTSARYGRMQLGSCVKKDLGYIGCYTDVLHLADKKCSGRRQCEIRMPDPTFDSTKPCLEELKTYLEASYVCVKVYQPANNCLEPGGLYLTQQSGYLSSLATLETLCGSETTPYVIKAKPGQRINVTFYDFNLATQNQLPYHLDSPSMAECEGYGYLLDPSVRRRIKICPGRKRIQSIYVSHNFTLEVVLKKRAVVERGLHFMVHYEIIGCPELSLPDDMFFRPLGENDGIIGCLNSPSTWPVTCQNNQWLGKWGNCTQYGVIKPRAEVEEHHSRSELSAVVIVGITSIVLVMVCAVVGVGGYCLRRFFRRNSPDNSLDIAYAEEGEPFKPPEENIINDLTEEDYPKPCPIHNQEQYAMVMNKQNNRLRKLDGNDYSPIPLNRTGYETELSQDPVKYTQAQSMYFNDSPLSASRTYRFGGSRGSIRTSTHKDKCSPGRVRKVQCSPNNRKRKNVNRKLGRHKSQMEMLHVPKQTPCVHNTLPNIVILDNVKSNPRYSVLYKLMEINKDMHVSPKLKSRNATNLNNTI